MVGLIIGVHAGTVMEGTVREGIIRLMGTRGVVAVATGPKTKMKEKILSINVNSFLLLLVLFSRVIISLIFITFLL